MSDGGTRATGVASSRSASDRIGAALREVGRQMDARAEDHPPPGTVNVVAPPYPVPVLSRPAGALVGALARFVIDASPEARVALASQARAHELRWHRRDGDAGDFLIPLEDLSQLVVLTARRAIASAADSLDNESVMQALERLFQGWRIVASTMSRQGVDRDHHRHSTMVRQLADLNLALCHELRTPLHSMLLSTEVLDREMGGSSLRRKQIRALRSALANAESLLLNASVLARTPDAPRSLNGILPSTAVAPLVEVFDAVEQELGGRAQRGDVSLAFRAPVPNAAVDLLVARLVLSNLVTNAIKYADRAKPERWIEVRAALPVVADEGPRMLRLEVEDNGVGIARLAQARVFEPGFRAHPQLAEGTGLGLAIIRGLIEDRGGSVELESEEGRGTRVRVRLPMMAPGGGGSDGRDL